MKIRFMLIGCMLTLNACIKKDCKHIVHLDSFTKQNFTPIVGSYWVYRNSYGNYDSSWISDSWFGTLAPNCIENYNGIYSSSQNNINFKILAEAGNISKVTYYAYHDFGGGFCFDLATVNGQLVGATSPYDTLGNYSVNDYVFVKAFSITVGCSYLQKVVFVPGVGVVEKIISAGDTFKLTNYVLK